MNVISMDSKLIILLKYLQEKKYSTLDELAKKMEVSTRTIRNYIKQINEILGVDVAQVKSYKNNGYKLERYNKLKFLKIQQEYLESQVSFKLLTTPKDRIKYLIKKFAINDDTFKTDDLAEELNVSRTTFINDMKRITGVLKKFDLKIKGRTNEGISLHGNEINKRLFFLYYLHEELKDENCFLNDSRDIPLDRYIKIREKIKDLFKMNNYKISDDGLIAILNFITLLIIRLKQKKCIEKLNDMQEKLVNTDDFIIAQKISDIISEEFNIQLQKNEVIFLTLPLIGRYSPIKDEINNLNINPNIDILINHIFDQIYEDMGLDLKKDREILMNLKYHLNFAVNRMLFKLPINNPLLDDIKKYYPFPYALAKISARVIEKFYNVNVVEDEIGYLALHFGSYVEREDSKFFSISKIAIVCGTGIGTAKLLEIKLRKLFGNDKEIKVYSDFYVTAEMLNQFDIVFTTVNLGIEVNTIVVKLNAVFNDSEIIKEIEKKYSLKKYKVKDDDSKNPFVHLSVPKQQLFILNKKNYIDNIECMIDGLSKVVDLDNDFKKKVIEREEKAPTAFDNYVGLPHAVNYKSDKFLLSIGILENAIFWAGKDVKIIILLIIPSEEHIDADMVIKVYEEILKACQNIKFIEELSKVRSYKKFLEINRKENY